MLDQCRQPPLWSVMWANSRLSTTRNPANSCRNIAITVIEAGSDVENNTDSPREAHECSETNAALRSGVRAESYTWSPSQDQWGMLRPLGTSSADRW